MSDIFNEVDEELRRDKAAEAWNKHGSKLVALAVLFIAAVAGWRAWQSFSFNERARLGAAYEVATSLANSESPDAVAALTALAEKKSGSYPVLARFRLASDLARTARDDAARANAVSAFDSLANDAALPAEWRDLAKLRAAYVLIDHAPLADVEARLSPLISTSGAFRHAAREGVALAAYRAKAYDKALDAVQAIILDAETPSPLRQRAELLLGVLRSGPVAP